MDDEIWKEVNFGSFIPHYKYEVSSHGRIKSYAYEKENGRIINGSLVNGYRLAIFSGQELDVVWKEYIHRIVAKAFLTVPTEDHKYVLHMDYNRVNNNVRNLKWADLDGHIVHARNSPNYVTGRITYSKLSVNDVIRIKKILLRNNTRLKMVAKQFGITHTQLNRIRSGENWSHVKI